MEGWMVDWMDCWVRRWREPNDVSNIRCWMVGFGGSAPIPQPSKKDSRQGAQAARISGSLTRASASGSRRLSLRLCNVVHTEKHTDAGCAYVLKMGYA